MARCMCADGINDTDFIGQKQYHNAVHRDAEKVERQPEMLRGGELRPYQLVGLQWMVSLYINNLNGILADEMGLGKTIQTISFIAYLMEYKENRGPFLIVAPKAVLPNWRNEFMHWLPQEDTGCVAVLYDFNEIAFLGVSWDKCWQAIVSTPEHHCSFVESKA